MFLTPTSSFRTVVASGTLAVVCYTDRDVTGTIELASDARGTETVALGHAKFIAPHVIDWNVVEVE
jgi:hypothetical protein